MTHEQLKGIRDTAAQYAAATGISCCMLDPETGETQPPLPCPLCVDGRQCREVHRCSALQAERFGGSYVYFCENSLLFWVSPVIIDGAMITALTAGPVLVVDPEDIISETLQGSINRNLEALREGIRGIPEIDISRVHDLSEVLRMCASWASGYREHGMIENRDHLEQLSRVSEYIHELKQSQVPPSLFYPLDKEEQLRQVIRVGDRNTSQRLLNELLGIIFFSSGSSIERIKFRVLELLILLSRAALEGGAPESEVMELSFTCQREMSKLTSTEAIALWLSKILHTYTALVFDTRMIKHGDAILRSLQYMHQNYTEKITLQEIADYVSLSPTYFSRIFNEEMNCTVSTYINTLRVNQAKSLLKNTRYNLVDIAGIAGFEDQSYFSRVFKSITGMTPGTYRKRAGLYPDTTHEIHED